MPDTDPAETPPRAGWPDRVVVHLGAHKTATTHFQKALRRGARRFARQGVALYTPPDLRRGQKALAKRLGLSWSRGGRRDDWTPALLARMAQGHPRLVLSEENVLGRMSGASGRHGPALYPEAGARLAALSAAVAPLPLTLFLAIRDPAGYLASAYSQSLFGGFGEDFATFAARIPLHAVDWCDLVVRLRGVARVEEVVVWRKEDYPAVALHAADALAGGRIARPRWFDHPPLHEGLSARAAEAALAAPRGPDRAQAADAGRRAHPVGPDWPRLWPFDAETAALSREFYAAQWARLGTMAGVRRLEPPGVELPPPRQYLARSRKEMPMARTNPAQFISQVRAEVAKVVWPNRREVTLTTIMVFLLATVAAIFFFLVDLAIRTGLQGVLNVFGS